MQRITQTFVLMSLVGLLGCGGSGIKLQDVTGTVTFDGQPLVYGNIEFYPDRSKNHTGPVGYAEIIDGKFSTKETGKGVVVGPHRVQITGFEWRPVSVNDENVSQVDKPLFAGYEVALDVSAAEMTIAVPASASTPVPQRQAPVDRAP